MKVNKFDLLKAIYMLGENVKITTKKVICCDENTITESEIISDGTDEESYIINTKLLISILNKSSGNMIEITDGKVGAFNVATEGDIFIPSIDTTTSITIGGFDYNTLFSVAFCASKNTINPVLGGVNLKSDGDDVLVTATDTARLCQKRFENKSRGYSFNVILPILNIKIDENVLLHLSDNAVVFDSGKLKILSRLIAGTYPSVDKILNCSRPIHVVVDTKELSDSLNRMMIINDKRVTLIANNNTLELSSSSNIGNVKEDLKCECLDSIEISFNPQYLKDAIAGTNRVSLYFASNNRPFEFDDGDTKHIITVCR